jgi:hypothetical protein
MNTPIGSLAALKGSRYSSRRRKPTPLDHCPAAQANATALCVIRLRGIISIPLGRSLGAMNINRPPARYLGRARG